MLKSLWRALYPRRIFRPRWPSPIWALANRAADSVFPPRLPVVDVRALCVQRQNVGDSVGQ